MARRILIAAAVGFVLLLPAMVSGAPTLNRVEAQSAPGDSVASITLPSGRMGETKTTTEKYRAVNGSAGAAWSAQATMAGNLIHSVSGATMAPTAIWAETSPFAGTFTSLGTTYRTLQSAIPMATLTSGYFRLRVVIPASQSSGTYNGTLRVKTNDGADSNIQDISVQVEVTDTLNRLEAASAPGTQVAGVSMGTGIMGQTLTSTESFRGVINGSPVNWAMQARMSAATMSNGLGNTMATTAVRVETAPLTGTFTSMGTTWRSAQTAIPLANLNSGYFRFRVIVPASQANGTYTGTLELRTSGSGTSNVIQVPLTVTVQNTLNRLESATDPGNQVAGIALPTGKMGETKTSTDTFRAVINGTPGVNWTTQVRMAGNLTDGAGHTMLSSAIYTEGAPTTGVYTSLGTTYRTVQAAIPLATPTSGYFHLRAVIPASQFAATYTGTLNVRTTGSGTSNVVNVPISVEVTDTFRRLESASDPGNQVASIDMGSTIMGESRTTTESYRGVIHGSPVNWAMQARMSATTMSNGLGNTMATTAVYVETAPLTGAFTSMSTTWRSAQTAIPLATLESGYFRFRVIVPASQASGTYSGTLELRTSGSGTSNVVGIPFSVTVIQTLNRVERSSDTGNPLASYDMPSGVKGQTKTTTDTFRAVINGNPGAAWITQATMATANMTDSGTGNTLPTTAIYAETSPFTGTFTSLSTTYRSLHSAIPAATPTSGFFKLRVIAPTTQASGTYTGNLLVRVSASGTSNVITIPLTVTVQDTLARVELGSTPGVALTSYSIPETDPGTTMTTIDTFRAVLNGTYAAWTAQARMSTVNLTDPGSGFTLPSTAVYVETSPFSGTFVSLGNTWRNIQAAIPLATLQTGTFRLRAVIPGTQVSGSFEGTLNVQITNGTTSNMLSIPIVVDVRASLSVSCIATTTSCTDAVTSTVFAETPPGGSSAPQGPYKVNLANSTGYWALSAHISSTFTDASSGEVLPDSAIEVQGPLQAGAWDPLGSSVALQNGVANTVLSSGDFSLRLSPPPGQDSGGYEGVVTITASTL